jgi:hypothetical protein
MKDPIITERHGHFILTKGESWDYVLKDVKKLFDPDNGPIDGGTIAYFEPDFFNDDPRSAVLVIYNDGTKYFTKDHKMSEIIKRVYHLE